MTKHNILKNKETNEREGDFNMQKKDSVILRLSYSKKPKFEEELLALLTKYFNIRTLDQSKK